MLKCVNVTLALNSLNKKGGDVEEAVIILVPCIIRITQKARKAGVTNFCLSLQQVGNPFKTCLIGIPYINISEFGNWTHLGPLLNESIIRQ